MKMKDFFLSFLLLVLWFDYNQVMGSEEDKGKKFTENYKQLQDKQQWVETKILTKDAMSYVKNLISQEQNYISNMKQNEIDDLNEELMKEKQISLRQKNKMKKIFENLKIMPKEHIKKYIRQVYNVFMSNMSESDVLPEKEEYLIDLKNELEKVQNENIQLRNENIRLRNSIIENERLSDANIFKKKIMFKEEIQTSNEKIENKLTQVSQENIISSDEKNSIHVDLKEKIEDYLDLKYQKHLAQVVNLFTTTWVKELTLEQFQRITALFSKLFLYFNNGWDNGGFDGFDFELAFISFGATIYSNIEKENSEFKESIFKFDDNIKQMMKSEWWNEKGRKIYNDISEESWSKYYKEMNTHKNNCEPPLYLLKLRIENYKQLDSPYEQVLFKLGMLLGENDILKSFQNQED